MADIGLRVSYKLERQDEKRTKCFLSAFLITSAGTLLNWRKGAIELHLCRQSSVKNLMRASVGNTPVFFNHFAKFKAMLCWNCPASLQTYLKHGLKNSGQSLSERQHQKRSQWKSPSSRLLHEHHVHNQGES
jgi:hypothetical protein